MSEKKERIFRLLRAFERLFVNLLSNYGARTRTALDYEFPDLRGLRWYIKKDGDRSKRINKSIFGCP